MQSAPTARPSRRNGLSRRNGALQPKLALLGNFHFFRPPPVSLPSREDAESARPAQRRRRSSVHLSVSHRNARDRRLRGGLASSRLGGESLSVTAACVQLGSIFGFKKGDMKSTTRHKSSNRPAHGGRDSGRRSMPRRLRALRALRVDPACDRLALLGRNRSTPAIVRRSEATWRKSARIGFARQNRFPPGGAGGLGGPLRGMADIR